MCDVCPVRNGSLLMILRQVVEITSSGDHPVSQITDLEA